MAYESLSILTSESSSGVDVEQASTKLIASSDLLKLESLFSLSLTLT
jgi:hypothetical protein